LSLLWPRVSNIQGAPPLSSVSYMVVVFTINKIIKQPTLNHVVVVLIIIIIIIIGKLYIYIYIYIYNEVTLSERA
jgi:hypothetical protein